MWKVWTILLLCLCISSESVFGFVPQSQSIRLLDDLVPTSSSSSSSSRRSLASRISNTQLYAEEKKNSKGVYVRPSGAIEKGSGFFVPGLEGPKVRVVFGSVLLLLTAVNHITSPTPFESLSFEEIIAVLYSLLVLFQAAIEFGKEELIVEGSSRAVKSRSSSGTNEALVQQWATSNTNIDEDEKSKIQWAAASYLSITPATQIMLLEGGSAESGSQIVFRLGSTSMTPKDESVGIEAALTQLQQSKGGRISLPLTHPAAVALGLSDDEQGSSSSTRCIILQRITDNSCWLVTSDQLLASFAQTDLKWLGRLAAYVGSS
ncbi:MAG: hypothetical protein SGBAC_004117 [Bacillariaceae sp.]